MTCHKYEYTLFSQNPYKTMSLKFRNMLRTYPKLMKSEKPLCWILHKIIEIVSRLTFFNTTSPIVLCLYKFVFQSFFISYYISSLLNAGQGSA